MPEAISAVLGDCELVVLWIRRSGSLRPESDREQIIGFVVASGGFDACDEMHDA